MEIQTKGSDAAVVRCADMFKALGAEARLRIVRALLRAHPQGLVVGDVQAALEIPASTLSHHLERLKHEGLVTMERQSNFLRYRVNADALQELIEFLMKECCAESKAVSVEDLVACCPPAAKGKREHSRAVYGQLLSQPNGRGFLAQLRSPARS